MKKTIIVLAALLLLRLMLFAEEAVKPVSGKPIPRFESHGSFVLMGLETKEPFVDDNMMKIWMNFLKIEDKIPDQVSKAYYGVSYYGEDYDPDTMKGMIYFAGAEVKEGTEAQEGFLLHKVPGGYYAVFEHRGDIGTVGKTYDYIYNDWLPQSGYKSAYQDQLELYDERFKDGSEDSVMEIWVPLQVPIDEE